jgi:hypothetical protein
MERISQLTSESDSRLEGIGPGFGDAVYSVHEAETNTIYANDSMGK